jgi:putative ABC transport system permease protein
MRIPIKYNIRSLMIRRVGTIMTALGIGLTVAVVVVMLAMVNGLDRTFTETGDEQNLVILREGSLNEVNSYFTRDLFEIIRFLPGVMRNAENEPLAVGELTVVITHPRKDGEDSNVMVRGTSETGFQLRPEVQLVEGRKFRDGLREMIVSQALTNRFADFNVGDTIVINRTEWKIVGSFESEGGAYDSELWAGYQDAAQVWQRPIFSSVLMRGESLEAAQELIQRIEDDDRIQLNAVTQSEYYAEQTVSSIGLKALAVFIAILMGVGACFAIMNMMYGMVMGRQQEIATLRALGFRRRSILASFLAESAILALVGGALGCALGFLFNGYSAGTSNFASFTEVLFNFQVSPKIIAVGLTFSLIMGVLGGVLPARRAAWTRLIDVLRE